MKRFLSMLLAACMALTLPGCGSGFSANRREVQQLLVVQVMGFDRLPGGRLSLAMASAADSKQGDGPVRMSGEGVSVTDSIEAIRADSGEEDLFCAHIGHILLGESILEDGLEPVLRYVERSSDIRIDVPLFLVRGSEAKEAVLETGDERVGISELLRSIEGSARIRGDGPVFTLTQIASALDRCGSAMLCAVKLTDSSEAGKDGEEPSKTIAPDGYAILKDGRLAGYIESDDACAVAFLLGKGGVHELSVRDRKGQSVTLAVSSAGASVLPERDENGQLTALDISVSLSASVSEIAGSGDLESAEYEGTLISALEREVLERCKAALTLSKELSADFLGLGHAVAIRSSARERQRDGDFSTMLPELSVRLRVGVTLSHANDVREGGA